MIMSLTTVVFAETKETTVTYTGLETESYTLTVPSTLSPGQSGTVKLEGNWPSNRTVSVSAPNTVTLTNNLDSATKSLAVTFDDISQIGDNTKTVSVSKSISVADISNVLFGTWGGVITYNVSAETVNEDVEEDDSIYLPNPTNGGMGGGNLNDGIIKLSEGDNQAQATWSYSSSNHTPVTHTCSICGNSIIYDSCNFAGATNEYNQDLAAANQYAEELRALRSDWDVVVNAGTAPSDGTVPGNEGSDCDGDHKCIGHEVSCGPGSTTLQITPTTPCNSGFQCQGHSWTITVTVTMK